MYYGYSLEEDLPIVEFEPFARMLLNPLENLPGVSGAEIFGSMARDGRGRDIDLIVIGTEEQWQVFKHAVGASALKGSLARALVFDTMFNDVLFNFELLQDSPPFDVFLFPPNWRNRLDELQKEFAHDDPLFMRNISKDAKVLFATVPLLRG